MRFYYQGQILEDHPMASLDNRGLFYGDGLFESIHVVHGRALYLEQHWMRLMSSMRILRMEIPNEFTLAFLQDTLSKLFIADPDQAPRYRARITVWRQSGGLYTPTTNDVNYFISIDKVQGEVFTTAPGAREVELFKDHYQGSSLISRLKTNNKLINVLAGIYADENGYQDMLLLNEKKEVTEAIGGNLFVVHGHEIITPPLESGCLRGVMRNELRKQLVNMPEYDFAERSISPFELQRADEIFTTNVIQGIRPITKFRKKVYDSKISDQLQKKMRTLALLGA